MPTYTVKNVKSFRGMEGYGFECSLYKDGKRIGTVTDTADGGMLNFYFNDRSEEKILDDFCKTLPKWGSEYGNTEYDTDADIFVNNLVNKFEEDKRWKKKCKTKTIVKVTPNDSLKKKEIWEYKRDFQTVTPEIRQNIVKQYPDANVEFINERYL